MLPWKGSPILSRISPSAGGNPPKLPLPGLSPCMAGLSRQEPHTLPSVTSGIAALQPLVAPTRMTATGLVLALPRLEWLRFIADTRNPLGVMLRVSGAEKPGLQK
jgi:hypothetical protein